MYLKPVWCFQLMDLRELLRQPFDAESALEAYKKWCKSSRQTSLDAALEKLLPLVTIVLWQEFRSRENSHDDLMSEATAWLLKDLKAKKFKKDDPASFVAYWRMHIRTTMLGYLQRQTASAIIDYDWHCREYPYVNVPGQLETVFSEFRAKLPEEIKDRVLNDVRFEGQAYKACVYILEQLLEARPVVVRVLAKRYGLKNHQFYRDYVGVLIRKALYDIRPDADERQVAREDILRATRFDLLRDERWTRKSGS